jgi:hypothetical protein
VREKRLHRSRFDRGALTIGIVILFLGTFLAISYFVSGKLPLISWIVPIVQGMLVIGIVVSQAGPWRKNALLYWLLRRSILTLIVLFVSFHFVLAICFAFAYDHMSRVSIIDRGERKELAGFLSHIPFSLITQTTSTFGDLVPEGNGRYIAAVQVMGGIILNAIAMGLIVGKFVRREPGILFPKKLAYHGQKDHTLYFLIWNRDADKFVDLNVSVKISRLEKFDVPPYELFQTFPVALLRKEPSVIDSNTVLWITTVSEGLDPEAPKELGQDENPIAITSLKPGDRLDLVATAVSVNRGDHVTAAHTYKIEDIECGEYIRGQAKNFGKIGSRADKECEKCKVLRKCPLAQAKRFIARDGKAEPVPTELI